MLKSDREEGVIVYRTPEGLERGGGGGPEVRTRCTTVKTESSWGEGPLFTKKKTIG